jgi:predicted transcriptional regulator of viral defense system
MQNKMKLLLKSGHNVFNMDDLGLVWGQNKRSDTVQSARDYARKGELTRLRRGLYAVDPQNIQIEEVAGRAFTPSYVTGETVLAMKGLIFPATTEIHCAALKPKKITVGNTEIIYHMLKPEVFYNTIGIENRNNFAVASLERAIADLIYIYDGKYDFERLHDVEWDKLVEIGKIYQKNVVVERIDDLRRKYGQL